VNTINAGTPPRTSQGSFRHKNGRQMGGSKLKYHPMIASVITIATGLLITSVNQSHAADDVTLRYLSIRANNHVYSEKVMAGFDRIKERSNGRLTIEFNNYRETPHRPQDGLSVLRDGLADMVEWYPGYVTNTYPLLGAAELPLLSPTLVSAQEGLEIASRAWEVPAVRKALEEITASFDATVGMRLYFEPINLWTVAPISSSSEMSGLRIRANTAENAQMMEVLGATPNFMPSTEIYAAAQRNVVNGVLTSSGTVVASKLFEVLKGGFLYQSQFVTGAILLRKSAVETLPTDLKTILHEELKAIEADLREFMPLADAEARETLESMGVMLSLPTDEDYQRLRNIAVESVWPEWVQKAGPGAEEVLSDILAVAGQ